MSGFMMKLFRQNSLLLTMINSFIYDGNYYELLHHRYKHNSNEGQFLDVINNCSVNSNTQISPSFETVIKM